MSNRIQNKKGKLRKVSSRSLSESILLLSPLMFVVIILPLIVKAYTYDPKLIKFDWFNYATEAADFFLFYKQWIFVGVCALIVAIVVARAIYKKETIKFNKYLIPLGIYALLALLSTLFSKYRSFGFTGIYAQFENVFCLMGYMLLVYYAFLIIETEAELKLMINAVAIGALILGIIGTLQAIGHDPFSWNSVKSMVLGPGQDPNSLSIVFENGRVYTTLYNPNYVGLYTSFMIPLFSIMLMFAKKIREYILYSLVLITSVISLFGSQSKAGLVSIVVSIFFAFIIYRKAIIKKWFIVVPVLGLLVISFIVINSINNNAYVNAIANALKVTKSETPDITDLYTGDNGVTITFKGNTMVIQELENGEISLCDQDGNVIPYDVYDVTEDGDPVLMPLDDRYYEILVANYAENEDIDFCIFVKDTYFPISKTAVPGTYTYYNRMGKFSPIDSPETCIFDGYETFASGRGFIWSRTIPLIKHNLILGSGADTFVIEYPQYDYLGFYNYNNTTLTTKPHSWYLQVAVQTGLVSLLALLAFFGIYFIQSIKLYFSNKFTTVSSQIGLGVFICSISFLVSSISNDSSVAVSPVFWAIMGIGFVANIMEAKSKKENA